MRVRGEKRRRCFAAVKHKARRGFRGYPIATVALYGPTNVLATKLVAAIIEHEGAEPSEMRKWFSDDGDIRKAGVGDELRVFLKEHGARTVLMTDKLMGCPHEEGIDYREGTWCPKCPFWQGRDRFTGEMIR